MCAFLLLAARALGAPAGAVLVPRSGSAKKRSRHWNRATRPEELNIVQRDIEAAQYHRWVAASICWNGGCGSAMGAALPLSATSCSASPAPSMGYSERDRRKAGRGVDHELAGDGRPAGPKHELTTHDLTATAWGLQRYWLNSLE